MAEKSQVTPTGWSHYDDATTFSRVSPTGWDQLEAAGAPPAGTILPQMLQQGLYAGYGNAA